MTYRTNKKDEIRTLYEQLWSSHREGVAERLTLTTIFSVMYGGFLALTKEDLQSLSTTGFSSEILAAIIFLMLFSILSILFTLKVDYVMKKREKAAREIVIFWRLLDLDAKYNVCLVRKVSIGKLFPVYFSMCFCFLLVPILKMLLESVCIKMCGISVLLVILPPVALFMTATVFLWKLKY